MYVEELSVRSRVRIPSTETVISFVPLVDEATTAGLSIYPRIHPTKYLYAKQKQIMRCNALLGWNTNQTKRIVLIISY